MMCVHHCPPEDVLSTFLSDSSSSKSEAGQYYSCVDWICVQFEMQHHLLDLIITL